jgi:hypothetical protein
VTRGATRSAVTFIVRASRDAGGRLHGIVERVKTGEKERFDGAEALARIIERMVATREGGRGKP